jgi:hypothetical protein
MGARDLNKGISSRTLKQYFPKAHADTRITKPLLPSCTGIITVVPWADTMRKLSRADIWSISKHVAASLRPQSESGLYSR